jgi:DNA-binding NarL/FixJ family response regulator
MTVSVYQASASLKKLPVEIIQQFRLSAEESQLCLGLVQGKSLDDMADELCQSRAILRRQYNSLLSKVGTNTEAKLVTTVLSSPCVASIQQDRI